MKNKLLRRSILLLLVLLPISLSDCKKKEEPPKEKDYYVVDVKQDTDWDYWIIGKGGESFFIQLQNSIPSVIYYKPLTYQDGYSIFLDNNGIPSKAIIDDYVFLFGNFRKSLMDISVVLPNSEIKIFRDLHVDYDFTSGYSKSLTDIQALSDVIRWTGRAVGVAACGVGLAAAIPTGGISLALTAIGCGTTVIGIITEFLPSNLEIMGLSATTVGTFTNIVGCINISNPTGAIACALGLASKGLAITAAAVQDSEKKKDLITAATAQLKTGLKVITSQITTVTSTTANVGGFVTSEDLAAITDRGVYYGTSQNPQTTGTKLLIGSGPGTFSAALTGLTSSTLYYIIAYAINKEGIGYGSQLNFTTSAEAPNPNSEILFKKGLKSNGDVSIYKMNADGSNISSIHPAGSFSIGTAIWSNDKKKILYSSNVTSSGKTEIFIMNSDGSGNTQLTFDNPQYGNNSGIFRNKSKIWYANAQSTGWTEFTQIKYDGSGKLKLTNFNSQNNSCDEISIPEDSSNVCYYKQGSSNGPSGRIYISNIDFTNEHRLTSNTTWEAYPQIAQNGLKVAYIRGTGQVLMNIFVINIDGTGDTKLTSISSQNTYALKPRWSPDGKMIAYSVFDGSQYDIWTMNSDGTGNKNITNTADYNELITDWK